MKNSTFIGIIIGLAAIVGAFILEDGSILSLFQLPALMIVIGGTLAAGLASTSWQIFSKIFKLMQLSFNPPKHEKKTVIFELLHMAVMSRYLGLLSLERYFTSRTHPYLKKMFQVCIDGGNEDTLADMYEVETANITERHSNNINLFNKLGGFSPTMGIIGTVMGLISTMAAAGGDPNKLIHSIGIAFLATLWGIVMANLIWIPVADKLQLIHNEEMHLLGVIFEGVRAVQIGDPPAVIYTRLASSFPIAEQTFFLKEAKTVVDKSKQIAFSAEETLDQTVL